LHFGLRLLCFNLYLLLLLLILVTNSLITLHSLHNSLFCVLFLLHSHVYSANYNSRHHTNHSNHLIVTLTITLLLPSLLITIPYCLFNHWCIKLYCISLLFHLFHYNWIFLLLLSLLWLLHLLFVILFQPSLLFSSILYIS
jgi:hypothetical protein